MVISTKGRYALRLMIDLAQHCDEGFISLKTVSQRQDVSLKYMEAIAAALNRANLVNSQRGKEGGYRLSRPASEITVAEVLHSTEGSMAAVSGRLQIREWTDREGGKRTTAEVVADNVYFGESKRRDGGDTSRPAAPSASAPAHRGSYGGYDNVPQGGSAFSELDDDDGDLPF